MSGKELGRELAKMYRSGMAKGEAMAMVVLFGIKYAKEINDCKSTVPAIVRLSRIRCKNGNGAKSKSSYCPEVNRGVQLAHYVDLNEEGGGLFAS